MPVLKEKPAVKIPKCVGCEKCKASSGEILYSLQHNGRYLCSTCFFNTPVGKMWPEPKKKSSRVVLSEEERRALMGE